MATAYCPVCDAEVSVVETVRWQDDLCATCGNALPEQDPDD